MGRFSGWVAMAILAAIIVSVVWVAIVQVTCWATSQNYPVFEVKRHGFACTVEGVDRDKFMINYYRQEPMMRCSIYGECDAKDREAHGSGDREPKTIQEK